MNWGVFVSTFLAASIEVIEMVAIVVAIGVTRSSRAARVGAAGGLVVLAVTIVALGAALQGLSLETLRLVVGALLLAFGSQWYRKGILIVSRDGWATGVGAEDVDDDVPAGFDWTGAFLSFKGRSLSVHCLNPRYLRVIPGTHACRPRARKRRFAGISGSEVPQIYCLPCRRPRVQIPSAAFPDPALQNLKRGLGGVAERGPAR